MVLRALNSERMVGNPETGEKARFEDISPVKSAFRHQSHN